MHKWILISALATLSCACASDRRAPRDPALIAAIIDAVEDGWEQGDPAPFERHFLDFPGARYVESGGQNVGLRDLVDHHVVPEKDVLESLELSFDDVEVHFEDDFAWALASVEVRAVVRADGRVIDKTGYETFLFRDVGGRWMVVHTHSSTRPRKR